MEVVSRTRHMLDSKISRFRSPLYFLFFWITNSVTLFYLQGCASSHHAPVIERAPVSAKASSPVRYKPNEPDWRPDIYVVKKGDTLYSIALEHGLDYRELAEWNNISDPHVIMIERRLKLKQPQQARTAPLVKPAVDSPAAGAEGVLKTQPKPVKQPYSEKALAQAEASPADKSNKLENASLAEPKSAAVVEDDDQVDWSWPATGKVLSGFSDNQNAKGMDISGKIGQEVRAAAPGKVVYSGSGLRGYGKLIIIKHNKTFLSAYAHNSQILVKEGQTVAKGYKIAEMGDSDADQAKLHFEIRRLGKPVDPLKYLPSSGG